MTYKRKSNYELKEIGGETLLIPRGAETVDFNNVTVFNEAGALLLGAMNEATDVDSLAQMLVEKYNIQPDEAKADTEAYIQKMLDAGIIEAV